MAAIPDSDEVRRIVREEIARALGGRTPGVRREALSKREAARMLGVDRGKGLAELIEGGHLRAVEIRGRVCIPREDVERVIATGAPGPEAPTRRRVGAVGGAAQLRALRIEG